MHKTYSPGIDWPLPEPWLGLKVLYEGARHAPMTFDLNPIYMVTPVEHTRQPFHISQGRQRIHIYIYSKWNKQWTRKMKQTPKLTIWSTPYPHHSHTRTWKRAKQNKTTDTWHSVLYWPWSTTRSLVHSHSIFIIIIPDTTLMHGCSN